MATNCCFTLGFTYVCMCRQFYKSVALKSSSLRMYVLTLLTAEMRRMATEAPLTTCFLGFVGGVTAVARKENVGRMPVDGAQPTKLLLSRMSDSAVTYWSHKVHSTKSVPCVHTHRFCVQFMSVVGNRYYTSHGSLPACCQPHCTVNTRGTSTSKQINVPCHASALQSRGTAEAHAPSWSTRHITLDYSTAHTSNKRTYTMFVIHQLGFTDLLCNSPPLSHTFVTPPRGEEGERGWTGGGRTMAVASNRLRGLLASIITQDNAQLPTR